MDDYSVRVARRVVSTLTATATAITMLGSAAIGLAASPADIALVEGDVISAHAADGDPDLYIVNEHGYKRLFLNPVIFGFYGHLGGFAAVNQVSTSERDAFPTSGLFRNCESGDERVYALDVTGEDVGFLHWVDVTGDEAVRQDPDFFKKVFCINNNEFAWYAKSPVAYSVLSQVPAYGRPPVTPPVATPGMKNELNGAAGELESVLLVSSFTNEEVGEGHIDSTVLGLDLEADNGSDLRLLTVRISFEHIGSGSKHLDDYAERISVFFGTKKVGTVAVSGFSESGSEWTALFDVDADSIIPMNETERVRVAVTALDAIDSADLDENWTVTVEEFRYEDASGFVRADNTTGDLPATRTFSFSSFSRAANVELKLTEEADNPRETSVLVDDEKKTNGVVLLSTKLQALGSDISVREMSFTVTPSGTGDAADIAEEFHLEINGTVVQTIDSDDCTISGDCDGTGTNTAVTYVFDDVDYALAKSGAVSVKLLADINKLDGTLFAAGDNLKADLDNDDTVAEDAMGETLATTQLIGAVDGYFQEFGAEGAVFFLMSTSATALTEGVSPDIGTFTITFGGTTTGTNSFVQENCTNDGGDGVDFLIIGSGSFQSCNVMSSASQTATHKNFRLVDGDPPATFTLTVVVNGDNDFVRIQMQGIDWLSSDIANPPAVYDVGVDDWETETLYLSAN